MRITLKAVLFALVVLLAVAVGASAQMGVGMRPPQMQGVWNPVVGSGGAYQVQSKGERKTEMEMAIVGSETLEGKPGYWMEMMVNDPRGEGKVYMKSLIVLDGKQTAVKRMIVQSPGQPPMEFPVTMLNRGGNAPEQPSDVRERGEHVGSESVTTPAGTFTCEHWRLKDGSADVWVSEKVAPWGVVKMTGRDANMTLVRVITNAKTRITGTPLRFDAVEMMRQRRNP